MKKTIAAALLLTSFGGFTHDVEGKTINQCNQPGRTYQSTSITKPDILKSIQQGQYAFRGIKLNQSYQGAIAKLGKPESLELIRDKKGTRIYADYSDYVYTFYSPKRFAKQNDVPVKGITMHLNGKQRILQSELTRILGPSTHQTAVLDEVMNESFNYLHAEHTEISNGFLAESVTMSHLKYTDVINAYYDEETWVPFTKLLPTALTNSALKAMKKGTYTYKGVKLGDMQTTVLKKLGTSNRDEVVGEYLDEEGYQSLDAYYGSNNWIDLTYDAANCDNRFKMDSMSFTYNRVKVSEAKIREVLGKPSDAYTDYYEDDETGDTVYDKTLSYPNLDIYLTKVGKTYYVDSVTYSKY
ncbi:hypothetical protein [Macrococcus animalis]|uniref:hypothetical protein n=1 Tax=Macrococcus animalis TaxID=3395467 RepID=UPI0039BDEAAD